MSNMSDLIYSFVFCQALFRSRKWKKQKQEIQKRAYVIIQTYHTPPPLTFQKRKLVFLGLIVDLPHKK